MRTKALLVGAMAGAVGPAVWLDEGVWIVEKHPSVVLSWAEGVEVERSDDKFTFKGKVRLLTHVIDTHEGDPIHLDAVQVSRA